MKNERELRSNIKKLWRHLPYILNMKYKTRPICLSLHITSKCNLNCSFCYIKNIDRTQELDYNKLINFIKIIKPKSVQLTGGEPCLYPHVNELIIFLALHRIKIGMFTNGTYIKNIHLLHHFDWLRISINHFIDNNIEFKEPDYPKNLGYIYIKHRNSPEDLKNKLVDFMDNHRGTYLKVIKDVFNLTSIKFKSILKKRIIVPTIEPLVHYKGKCYMGFLKPYINGDGLIYSCVSTVNPKEKIRDKRKAITDIDHPQHLLRYHDIIMDCKQCRFWDRNEFIEYIYKKEIEDEDFL